MENKGKMNARITGALFIIATVAGVLAVIFFGSTLESPVDLTKISANETQVVIGAVFYFIMAAACAGIAIPIYPILKQHNEGMALGAVGFRIIEGVLYMVGVMCVLAIVLLSQEFVDAVTPADPYFQTLGELLLAGQDLAQALVPGVFAFSLGALMYQFIFFQSNLIPRWLSVWGLIGSTLVFVSGLVTIFGGSALSPISDLLNFPNFVGEMVLAVWLIIKGFNSSTIVSESV